MVRERVLTLTNELMIAKNCDVRPKKTNDEMPSITARKLIEIRHEWVCSQCVCQFYNPGCVIAGHTLNEIIQRVKRMREQVFANHACINLWKELS
jgi:hypothetical protein